MTRGSPCFRSSLRDSVELSGASRLGGTPQGFLFSAFRLRASPPPSPACQPWHGCLAPHRLTQRSSCEDPCHRPSGMSSQCLFLVGLEAGNPRSRCRQVTPFQMAFFPCCRVSSRGRRDPLSQVASGHESHARGSAPQRLTSDCRQVAGLHRRAPEGRRRPARRAHTARVAAGAAGSRSCSAGVFLIPAKAGYLLPFAKFELDGTRRFRLLTGVHSGLRKVSVAAGVGGGSEAGCPPLV